MAKPTMKRWVCPDCGAGKLAPSKPRADDARRFCFPCSERTGRLVRRTVPSMDAARERRAQARKETAKRLREREAAALTERHVAAGLDVREEWARLLRLPFVRDRLPFRVVPLKVSWTTLKDYTTGHAHYGGQHVHLTFYRGVTRAEVRAILAHELAHVIAIDRGHGEAFRRTFALVLLHGYGVPIDSWEPLVGTMYEQHVAAERAIAAHEGVRADSGRIRHDERIAAKGGG